MTMQPPISREQQAQEWAQLHIADVPASNPGGQVAHGIPATPNPAPQSVPVERVMGGYADTYTGDDELHQDSGIDQAHGSQMRIAPVPLIGAIPFGGIIQQAGQQTLAAAGQFAILGDIGNNAPRVLGVFLWSPAAVGSFELVGDGLRDQPAAGATMPIGTGLPALWLPVRRVTIRATGGPFTLHYAIVGFETFR